MVASYSVTYGIREHWIFASTTRPCRDRFATSLSAHFEWNFNQRLLGRRMKLLICAECELGPIGWCEEGGSEFWIACSRVAYRG